MSLPKMLFLALLGAAAWARLGSLTPEAPASGLQNPLKGQERARLAGAKLYRRECSSCHGSNREGIGRAPSLRSPEVTQGPPAALFQILRNGSLRRGMPSFAHLPEAQRWQIITFLQEDTGH